MAKEVDRLQRVLAENLIILRAERGWSLRDVADRVGAIEGKRVPSPPILYVETCRSWPRPRRLRSLAQVYGVPAHTLLDPGYTAFLREHYGGKHDDSNGGARAR